MLRNRVLWIETYLEEGINGKKHFRDHVKEEKKSSQFSVILYDQFNQSIVKDFPFV